MRLAPAAAWIAVALFGAFSYASIAGLRGESVSAAHVVVAAVATLTLGYRAGMDLLRFSNWDGLCGMISTCRFGGGFA